jgi:hypothetical protein
VGGDEPQAGGAPGAETDPLVSNGLGSPLCTGSPGGASLPPASRRNCETSGFIGAAAPTGDFGIDVHIDTGLLGLSSAQLLAIVQNLFVTPLWMALVWAMHALVVMLEWCFTIDLLEGDTLRGGVTRGLREMQGAITMPWLATALAIAAVLCAYDGLVRRRVAHSLAQALTALAMIAGGLWITVDPTATVGALGEWANGASLGTLAVAARGSPGDPGGALASGMSQLFSTAIEVPWCYLEFGDVEWCRSPSRLDPKLHAAALALAGSELQADPCRGGAASPDCASRRSPETVALARSARLLRAARTNGAIFLALPANGPARNAINDPTSLLRAICRSETATDCHGPAAAAAEFRTNRGTWSRVGGLLLIAGGVLGLLLLLCFLALRLLGAAVFSLVYLLLAPVATLAPALGDAGRAAFRRWAAQLLAAVVAKLLFAFLLGVVLAILAILEHLQALGWWTRWLLMSAFWWGLFVRRHQLLQLAAGRDGAERTPQRRPVLRRVNETLDARARVVRRAGVARGRARTPPPELTAGSERGSSRLTTRVPVAGRPEGAGRESGAEEPLHASSREVSPAWASVGEPGAERGHLDAAGLAPGEGRRLDCGSAARASEEARRELIERQREQALAVGNLRRAALLAVRSQRIGREVDRGGGSREAQAGAGAARRRAEARERHERFLDAQAQIGAAGGGSASPGYEPAHGHGRSYAALAGTAGYSPREYTRLDRSGKASARERIDRELAQRRERSTMQIARRPTVAAPSESDVMRDARDVEAGRKRKLGPGRP